MKDQRGIFIVSRLLGVPGRERESFINRIRWPGRGESTCTLCAGPRLSLSLTRAPHAGSPSSSS